MSTEPQNDRRHPTQARWAHADFELASALKDATEPVDAQEASLALYRTVPWRRSAALLGAAFIAIALGAWAFVAWVYPPELVRVAMIHEHREATLRGDFQPDKEPMLAAIGVPPGTTLPGLLQLQRPCDIDGRMAYHLTTFLEKGGGMVTILAFEHPVADLPAAGQGQWMGRYWRFAKGLKGRTVLLLADNPQVLAETEHLLRQEQGSLSRPAPKTT